MKRDSIQRYLLGVLENKIPDKSKLIELLMETLFIEKGAVYRRLRGEVPFSFYEVAMIAEKLGISLNNLIAGKAELIESFVIDMSDIDYKKWDNYIALIHMAKKDTHSIFGASSNLLPATIYAKYESLYKFYVYKYQYLLRGTDNRVSFDKYILPEDLRQIYKAYFKESKTFAKTYLICDYFMISNLIIDIHYFSGVNLLFEDDVKQIKEDLFALIDYLEKIALSGCFDETGNSVELYISDINLDATYSYFQIDNSYTSLIRTFMINAVFVRDKPTFDKIKNWVQSLRKSSTLITKSGAAFRTEFFEKQRKIISEI